MATGILMVFDFDETIIDCDSDYLVIHDLGATHRFDEILRTVHWNSAVTRVIKELHSQGRTIEEIADSLRRAPLHPHTVSAIKTAHALGCELRIVSDANVFFIDTILKHHGLNGYFSKISTNPSYVDKEGRLKIFPYHDFTTSTHDCSLCPPNMCKGLIIENLRASVEGKKRFIYVGDGKGDFCPSLKLREEDYVVPRKGYPLWELICRNSEALNAKVHEWSDSKELERVLLQLLNKLITAEHNNDAPLLSVDCKSQEIPVSGHEVFP